ncbi:regulator SirB [Halioglobus maricola]|uniref:Regulator SirB n=1 Tax=Halioglobus maricola TaxID=2601894 RepID=A0A5P9NPD8_9GAMM|nr:SirB2 family protein [Halioglobus maricola]QFU77652.1 regulator SirB [Halioglobus maricola]
MSGRTQMFEWLKCLHVSCAVLSIAGFALRGYWVLSDNALRAHKLTRVAPHMVDTLLLASAIGMLVIWQVSPFQLDWVMVKIGALLLYIGLGMVTMRFARTRMWQSVSYVAALMVALYIVAVARAHSPLGPVSLVLG